MHYCLGATWEQGRGEIEMRESVQLSVEHLGVVMTGRKIEGRVGGGMFSRPQRSQLRYVSYLGMWFSSRKEN